MEKSKLVRFISKYHLAGNVSSVILQSKDNAMSTRFITGDKTLLGELSMKNWKFDECELGVYDTDQFLKLLGVLKNTISIDVKKAGDKAASLLFSDGYTKVMYMLTDLSLFNKTPDMKRIPSFNLKLKVDSRFIDTFISGKNALPDSRDFTVLTSGIKKENVAELVIGYDIINTNRVTIPIKAEVFEEIEQIKFNAEYFKQILIANKECESAVLEISSEGLARISFNVDDYSVIYYLVAIQN